MLWVILAGCENISAAEHFPPIPSQADFVVMLEWEKLSRDTALSCYFQKFEDSIGFVKTIDMEGKKPSCYAFSIKQESFAHNANSPVGTLLKNGAIIFRGELDYKHAMESSSNYDWRGADINGKRLGYYSSGDSLYLLPIRDGDIALTSSAKVLSEIANIRGDKETVIYRHHILRSQYDDISVGEGKTVISVWGLIPQSLKDSLGSNWGDIRAFMKILKLNNMEFVLEYVDYAAEYGISINPNGNNYQSILYIKMKNPSSAMILSGAIKLYDKLASVLPKSDSTGDSFEIQSISTEGDIVILKGIIPKTSVGKFIDCQR